jgi:hypothetical protein
MPPLHPPHPHPGHGGHAPPPWFGNWGWSGPPQYDTVMVESEAPPDWVWIAGGALVGIVLALLVRDR